MALRNWLRIGLILIFTFLVSCQKDRDEDRVDVARQALSEGQYSYAQSQLLQHLSRHPEDEDALRLLASVHLNRADFTIAEFHEFLGVMELDFFPETPRFENYYQSGLDSEDLLRMVFLLEDIVLKWNSLPEIDLQQSLAIDQAVQVLDQSESEANVKFRLLLRSVLLKNHITDQDQIHCLSDFAYFLNQAGRLLNDVLNDYILIEGEASEEVRRILSLRLPLIVDQGQLLYRANSEIVAGAICPF